MGLADVILGAGGSGADPVIVAAITALLSGGGVSALLGYRRVRSGAQLDVLSAAKVIYEEQRQELIEVRGQSRELRIQRDAALEGQRVAIERMDACNERIDELEVKVVARQETIEGLQALLEETRGR